MDHILIGDSEVLAFLAKDDLHLSPEEFLLWLEDALESGEITTDEAAQLIADYNKPSR